MRYNDTAAKRLAEVQISAFTRAASRANLSGKSQSAIVGISRSRWTQLCNDPGQSVLQTHVFLNLLWGTNAIARGLDEGWLPAKGERGAAQDRALSHFETLASE